MGRARFSAPVQTGPGAYPASCTMDTGSFPGVKWPGRGADHPPTSKCLGHERVGLYLYPPSGHQWAVIGRAFTFTFTGFAKNLDFSRAYPYRQGSVIRHIRETEMSWPGTILSEPKKICIYGMKLDSFLHCLIFWTRHFNGAFIWWILCKRPHKSTS